MDTHPKPDTDANGDRRPNRNIDTRTQWHSDGNTDTHTHAGEDADAAVPTVRDTTRDLPGAARYRAIARSSGASLTRRR
jgi:hypothetical protein